MLFDGPDIAGSTTPELTVDAGNDDIGLYTVRITNTFETAMSRAAVLGIRQSCAADTDDDGVVGINDFLALLVGRVPVTRTAGVINLRQTARLDRPGRAVAVRLAGSVRRIKPTVSAGFSGGAA